MRLIAFAAPLMLAALACGSTEPTAAFVGAYELATVNGQPVPYTTMSSDITSTLNTGLLVISPRGEWSLATSGTMKIGAQVPTMTAEIITGTWHSEGGAVTLLSFDPPTSITATYSSGTISYSGGTTTYVFRRQ